MKYVMRGLKPELRDKETGSEPEGAGGSGTLLDPNPEGTGDKNSPPTDTGVESPFAEGPFKGKTLAEVEAEYSVMDAVVKEQGQQNSALQAQINNRPAADSTGIQTPHKEIPSEDYFANPAETTRAIVKSVLTEHMDEIIKPFTESLASGKIATAWAEAERTIPDISARRTLVQAKLTEFGFTEPNSTTIVSLYKMVLGDLVMAGDLGSTTPAVDPGDNNRPAPPQHGASNQPLTPPPGEGTLRKLTENEETLRRMRKQTTEEYLAMQALDEEDVIDSQIGVPAS